jgi:hypothetical protein
VLTIIAAVRVLSAWAKGEMLELAWVRGETSEPVRDWECGSTRP